MEVEPSPLPHPALTCVYVEKTSHCSSNGFEHALSPVSFEVVGLNHSGHISNHVPVERSSRGDIVDQAGLWNLLSTRTMFPLKAGQISGRNFLIHSSSE